ncbi:MAG: AtpZ/AtpI family protein [Bacteroidales bacterium]|jgi:F0F1-type ATP synthase assembly protein I|nr:AtpZ/AtpI family protein [Bacteroidales bacterium]
MKHDKKPLLAGYGRYSGLAFQMGILIFLGTYGGIKLDEKLQISPLFTIIGSLAGIAIAIYVVVKDFIIKKK